MTRYIVELEPGVWMSRLMCPILTSDEQLAQRFDSKDKAESVLDCVSRSGFGFDLAKIVEVES